MLFDQGTYIDDSVFRQVRSIRTVEINIDLWWSAVAAGGHEFDLDLFVYRLHHRLQGDDAVLDNLRHDSTADERAAIAFSTFRVAHSDLTPTRL